MTNQKILLEQAYCVLDEARNVNRKYAGGAKDTRSWQNFRRHLASSTSYGIRGFGFGGRNRRVQWLFHPPMAIIVLKGSDLRSTPQRHLPATSASTRVKQPFPELTICEVTPNTKINYSAPPLSTTSAIFVFLHSPLLRRLTLPTFPVFRRQYRLLWRPRHLSPFCLTSLAIRTASSWV